MKRSLVWKLALAFVLVAVTMAAIVWITLRLTNPAQFNALIVNQARTDFRNELTAYYEENGSWNGVWEYYQKLRANRFATEQASVPKLAQNSGGAPAANPPFRRDWRNLFGLADPAGAVLIPVNPEFTLGSRVPAKALADGEPIVIGGKTAGIILSGPRPPALSPEETAYLDRINLAVLLASLGALLVAVLMGFLLARTFIRPLQALTQAAHRMANGELKQEVALKSNDEIGELANAFNGMSHAVAQAQWARRQMTADVAHELRTPLTVIAGYIESIRDGVLAPTTERLATIYMEIEQLQRLVGDLHTLSQADAGELPLTFQAIDLATLLGQIRSTFALQTEQKGIQLGVDVPEKLPSIRGDETRLLQILSNIVSNAIRYTSSGGSIVLSAKPKAGTVELFIEDTGCGIPPEDIPHIFDRFFHAKESPSTGLGLAIAKALVEAHHGAIEASSAAGEGTVIRIVLPKNE